MYITRLFIDLLSSQITHSQHAIIHICCYHLEIFAKLNIESDGVVTNRKTFPEILHIHIHIDKVFQYRDSHTVAGNSCIKYYMPQQFRSKTQNSIIKKRKHKTTSHDMHIYEYHTSELDFFNLRQF